MKIIIITLSVFTVISVLFNFYQYDEITNLTYQNQYLEENNLQLKDDISNLSDDKYSLQNDIYILQSKIKKTKQRNLNSFTFHQNVEARYRALVDVEIRSQMTEGSAIVGEVPTGAIVEVLNSFHGSTVGWEIRYKGITGWVPTNQGDVFNHIDIWERVK